MIKKSDLFNPITAAVYRIQKPVLHNLPTWLPSRVIEAVEGLFHPFSSLFCWKLEHKIHLYEKVRAKANVNEVMIGHICSCDLPNTIDGNMLEHVLEENETMPCKNCRNARPLGIPEPTAGE